MPKPAYLKAALALLALAILAALLCRFWVDADPVSWILHRDNRRGWLTTEDADYGNQVLIWRMEAKGRVVRALEAGQLSFPEAAAWFYRLNDQPADLPHPSNPQLAGNREEQACLQVIGFLRGEPEMGGRAKRVERLEEELRQLLARPGGLVLPEPPSVEGMPPCPDRDE